MIYVAQSEFHISDITMRLDQVTDKVEFFVEFIGEIPFGNTPIEIKREKSFTVEQSVFLGHRDIRELVKFSLEKIHGIAVSL